MWVHIGLPETSILSLSSSLPVSEAVSPQAGSRREASDAGHVHERLTSAKWYTTDASGLCSVSFTRSFDVAPTFSFGARNPTGGPVIIEIVSDIVVGGKYVGVNLRAQKLRPLPALSGILLIGPLITALAGYNTWEPAANLPFSCIALAVSG